MNQNKKTSRKMQSAFVWLLSVNMILLMGCKENDLFDAERTKEIYEKSFPVKDIDPAQDWATTQSVVATIQVNEDQNETYTAKFYTANPLDETSNALMLSSCQVTNGEIVQITFDCPKELKEIWVSRVDKHKRRLLKPISISNNEINVEFGAKEQNSRNMTKAEGYNSLFDFPVIDYKKTYEEEEIEKLIQSAGKDKNGNYIQFTNAKQSDIKEGDVYIQSKSGEINPAKIVHGNGWHQRESVIKVIVTGENVKLTLPDDAIIQSGLEIIVTNGATLYIKEEVEVNNTGRITILKNGKLRGDELKFNNNGNLYNKGEIEMKEISLNGGYFYNAGSVKIDDGIKGNNTGSKIINIGKLEAEDIKEVFIENTCRLIVEDELNINGMILTSNSMVKCEKLEAYGSGNSTSGKQVIRMAGNSMLIVEDEAKFNNMGIWGPYEGNEYACVKIKEIEYCNYSPHVLETYVLNNVYVELEKHSGSSNFTKGMLNGINWSNDKWGNMHAAITTIKEAPVIVPSDECTEGNTPNEDGGDGDDSSIYYTYAFEDNYPQPGDYDFNDIILDVTQPQRKNKEVTFKVTLQAVGATKHIGAGIRLVGDARNEIESVKIEGEDASAFLRTLGGNNNLYMGNRNEQGFEEDCPEDKIIPLFGDAHKVMGRTEGNYMINTIHSLQNDYAPKTLTITLNFRQESSSKNFTLKDCLDFFITHNVVANVMGTSYHRTPRVEVHLYEYRDNPTSKGLIFKENQAMMGRITWAIMVPNFKYPKEWTDITKAYPKFSEWAKNMKENQDWHKSPEKDTTWR